MLVFPIFFIKNGPTINHDITLHLHAQLKPKEEQKNVPFFMLDLVNPRGNITNTTLYICMLLLASFASRQSTLPCIHYIWG